MEKKREFGIRLKTALMTHDMSQADLAERVGVTSVGISKLVKGKSLPTTKNLESICKALDVSADYLLGLTDSPER